MEKRKIEGKQFFRKLELDRNSVDDENRTIDASLSSEYPVERFFGTEVLLHRKDAVNLERAGDNGLPLLFNHDHGALIGRARGVKLKNGKLRARLDFSQNSELACDVWADIRDSFLTDISIGYEINEVRETDDTVEVTRWTPLEASVVSVAADPSIGINRGKQTMTDKDKSEIDEQGGSDDFTIADFQTARDQSRRQGSEDGTKLERARVKDITRLYGLYAGRDGVDALQQQCIDQGVSAKRAGELLLEYIAGEPEPVTSDQRQSDDHHGRAIQGGKDESEKWAEGVSEALEIRAGVITGEKAREARRGNHFIGMTLNDIARDYLERQRANMSGLSRQQIAGQAFTRAGMHGTSDFANVLENVASKSLLMGYNEAPETWSTWCRTGSLTDFKVASRVNISTFSDLEVVVESAEYKEGHLSDLKETIQLAKYGKTFTISREAIINDDLDAMSRIPAAMGRAAARQVGDLAYGILTANATLNQDGLALFVAGHGNLAASGAVISEATLDAGRLAMSTQTAPAPGTGETGATLNIAPAYLIVPSAILMAARKVVETPTSPDTTGDLAVNTMRNALTVVWDARLDADSATQWYLAASPSMADTVEVAFLDGNDQPYMESKDGFKQDGVTYKVRIEAAAAALDFRGLYTNPGA